MSNSFVETKRRTLEQRLAALTEEYQSASAQLDSALGAAEQVRIKRQIKGIESKISEVEKELNDLGTNTSGSGISGTVSSGISSPTDGIPPVISPEAKVPGSKVRPKADEERRSRDEPEPSPPLPPWFLPTGFIVGIVALATILALVIFIPQPSAPQFFVFRVLMALGGAAFSMAITGFIVLKLDLPGKSYLIAGGSLAVFVILFFFTPPIIPIDRKEDPRTQAPTPAELLAFKEWHDEFYGRDTLDTNKWDAPPNWKLEHVEGKDTNIKALVITGEEIGLIKLPDKTQRPSNSNVHFVIIVAEGQSSASWILRAQDKHNFYLFTLKFPTNGHNAAVNGYLYSNGKASRELDKTNSPANAVLGPLPYTGPFYKDDTIFVTIDLNGEQFSHNVKLVSAEVTKSLKGEPYDPQKINDKSDVEVFFTFIDQSNSYPSGLFGLKAGAGDTLIIRDVTIKAGSTN